MMTSTQPDSPACTGEMQQPFAMTIPNEKPRVLIVTPEVTYLPPGMGNMANYLTAKAGGLADVSAALISSLFDLGADVHVAMPDYRAMFRHQTEPLFEKEKRVIYSKMPNDRIHLAEDRAFFYRPQVYSGYVEENLKIALAFQREVINNVIPHVQPDLLHCNDWMTALVPAAARAMGIPGLFTIHNIHSEKTTMAFIEDRGIDAAEFWQHLFFESNPSNYEESREYNRVDLLPSGIFAAHFVNTVSPTFLKEIVEGRHAFVEQPIRQELSNKYYAGCAFGIINAPDPSYKPSTDPVLKRNFTAETHRVGKQENKLFLQQTLQMNENPGAPLFFWPSRLDNYQKGCQLLADILYDVVSQYWTDDIQIVFVANGDYQQTFRSIVEFHGFQKRVAVCGFDETLSRLGFAAADFVLMPSRFEPCGLPQMIGPIYGSLPVVHDTGGLHDTVIHLDVNKDSGNGFVFRFFDAAGFSWAISEAMRFHRLAAELRERQIKRVITQAEARFTQVNTARQYIDLYENMLQRPLL